MLCAVVFVSTVTFPLLPFFPFFLIFFLAISLSKYRSRIRICMDVSFLWGFLLSLCFGVSLKIALQGVGSIYVFTVHSKGL